MYKKYNYDNLVNSLKTGKYFQLKYGEGMK